MATTVPTLATRVWQAAARRALQTSVRVAPDTTARVAYRLFTRPPQRMVLRPAAAAVQARGVPVTVRFDGDALAAWTWGDGPTVLVLHGWAARAGQLAAFVDPLVARGLRVLAVDGPAHGASPGGRANAYVFSRVVQAIVADRGPLHGVVAHSMGAAATVHALRQGASVGRLALVSPAASPKAYFTRFGRQAGLTDDAIHTLRRRVEDRVGIPFDDLDIGPTLAQHAGPVLVVHDRTDREAPYADGAAIAAAAPAGTLYTTEGLGHARILADADVVHTVADFLDPRSATAPTGC